MELKFKTNINCSGCITKVTPFLDNAEGIYEWSVDTANPNKILTVNAENSLTEFVKRKVEEAGFKIELISSS
ncbi:heavy-metal-associated domain-containing protein [Solitalea koreensis]|uniref:Copper chaperone n=1 Tax=Solitalea koreensis TaxID=543615 RepID=A0A521DCW0_9SPHI|nr:hypothetical protein [Solitalea koreensis]SMO68981.1 copper chaperone [Solitalea koreensis]